MSEPTFKANFLRNATDFTVEDPSNIEEIKRKYDEWGFVVVKSILSVEDCKQAETLIYQDLISCVDELKITDRGLRTVYRNVKKILHPEPGSKTPGEHFPKDSLPGLAYKGFLSLYGLPQGKFAWNLRTNPIVKSIYAGLHDCTEDELCVSLDVPFFSPDSSSSRDECYIWSHADQNIHVKIGSPESHQGILYVWDSTEHGTSNTIVIPKSHKNEYFELLAAIPEYSYDAHNGLYIRNIPDLEERERLLKVWCEKSRRIPVPAGALLIFNSRTIHQGYQNGLRLAQTICWEPKIYRTEEALIKKLQACAMGIATTHWASLGIHHGVSFIPSRKQKYVGIGKFHHRNIFPLKNIELEVLTTEANEMQHKSGRLPKNSVVGLDELMSSIKPEYRDIL